MYTKDDYTAVMSRSDSEWQKYGSASNFEKIIAHQVKYQFIPSKVSLLRAIKELGLRRIDGKTAADDARELRAAAQANFDSVVAEAQRIPLSVEELQGFASLSPLELSKKYFNEDGDYFRIRYSMAMKAFRFREPQRFASLGNNVQEDDDGEALELSPSEYNSIPAQTITRRYMTDKSFKAAVDKLIKAGLITLVFFVTTYVGVA